MSQQNDRYRQEVKDLICEVFHLPREAVSDRLAFGEISEWDSLGHMDLLMALESRYDIPLDEELITRLISVEAICTYLQERDHA